MFARIKGMYDILPPESLLWRLLENAFHETARRYGFHEARTPLVEPTELFGRSLGETSDVVEKEMYSFLDKSERALTLRPEGTASIVRAYVENKVAAVDPIAKWTYGGPMYRYERPQKGRNRQFHQLGAEAFGVGKPEQDAEMILLAYDFFRTFGLAERVRIELNSLGDPADRAAYRTLLRAYMQDRRGQLCEDCLRRLDTNPMRVLDCKNPSCQEAGREAPLLIDHLGEEARTHFAGVQAVLKAAEVPFVVNPRIVRGLDYYNRTAFEFKGEGLGAQDAVGGGGRYDGLVAEMGGAPTPAVGFALGLERVLLLAEAAGIKAVPTLDFYAIPMGEAAKLEMFRMAAQLRAAGLAGEVDVSERRLKHLLARAERVGARLVLLLGDNELAAGHLQVRDMATKETREVALAEAVAVCLAARSEAS